MLMAEIVVIDSEWEVCSNCEYWHQDEKDPLWGRCCEGPPQGFLAGNEVTWLNPHMHAKAGCGRFVRRVIGRTTIQVEGEANGLE